MLAVCGAIGLLVDRPAMAANAAQLRAEFVPANLSAPQLDVAAWALYEMDSGWVVAGDNLTQSLPPASITKLMTNLVVFDAVREGRLSLDSEVAISEAAWRAEGSRMFANVDSRVAVRHLLKSSIIQSGNDAAMALAEAVAGSEAKFVDLMNERARRLGLSGSHFANSTGLPQAGHVMSATDIARLSAEIITQYPDFFAWYGEKEYRHNNITQYNRNRLLWRDPSVDGLKTGHTDAAGYCLVGTARRNEQRWIAVVLGADSSDAREAAVQDLLNYAFAAFQPVPVLQQQGGVTEVPVYFGESQSVRLRTSEPATVVVAAGREHDLQYQFQTQPYYSAPIALDQAMGSAAILLDDELLASVPLQALSAVAAGSWWKRFSDDIRLRLSMAPGE